MGFWDIFKGLLHQEQEYQDYRDTMEPKPWQERYRSEALDYDLDPEDFSSREAFLAELEDAREEADREEWREEHEDRAQELGLDPEDYDSEDELLSDMESEAAGSDFDDDF